MINCYSDSRYSMAKFLCIVVLIYETSLFDFWDKYNSIVKNNIKIVWKSGLKSYLS